MKKCQPKKKSFGIKNLELSGSNMGILTQNTSMVLLQDESGTWIDQPDDLEQLATGYFRNLFSMHDTAIPFHMQNSFPILDDAMVRNLAKDVTDEENFQIVKSFGAFKAPNPDGFQTIFYHSQWQLVGASFCEMIKKIFEEPRRVAEINKTFTTLIPKVD